MSEVGFWIFRANIRGLGASLSMIMRFIPLRIHWVALKPIFCYVLGATSLWEFNMEVAHKPKMLERPLKCPSPIRVFWWESVWVPFNKDLSQNEHDYMI